MVGVAPRILQSGFRKRSPKIIRTAPSIKASAKPVAAASFACRVSPAPRRRDMKLPEPWPQKKPKALMIAMTEKTMPTAAVACVDMRPTKKVSAML